MTNNESPDNCDGVNSSRVTFSAVNESIEVDNNTSGDEEANDVSNADQSSTSLNNSKRKSKVSAVLCVYPYCINRRYIFC